MLALVFVGSLISIKQSFVRPIFTQHLAVFYLTCHEISAPSLYYVHSLIRKWWGQSRGFMIPAIDRS